MNRSITISIVAGALVLAVAAALQRYKLRDIKEGDRHSAARPVMLAERLPRALPGWTGRDAPLGSTEIVRSATEKILNFDDFANRIFRRSGGEFGVYVAYWSPGRMPVQKVASHTPDRCWSENGWTCEALRAGEQVPWREGVLKPAYWRIFTPPANHGARQYVLYWHLVGGELYDYGTGFNRKPNPIQWWRETVHYALKGSADQYFIRLTSDRPFEEIWQDPGFQEVLSALAKLGLAED